MLLVLKLVMEKRTTTPLFRAAVAVVTVVETVEEFCAILVENFRGLFLPTNLYLYFAEALEKNNYA